MKTTLYGLLLALGLTVLGANGAAAWPRGDGFMDGPPSGRMLAYLADELDLSRDQELRIRTLHEELASETAADRERLRELRELLEQQRDDFDAGLAQQYADEVGLLTGRMVYAAARTHAAVNEVLTPEQREAMAELRQHRDERRERWAHKHRKAPAEQ